jgi:hypothetical protein
MKFAVFAGMALALAMPLRAQGTSDAGGATSFSTTLGSGAATVEDFRKFLIDHNWTWERAGVAPAPILFKTDGSMEAPSFKATILIRSPRVVELLLKGRKATLKFNSDLTGYEGTDFDGVRPIHGRRTN